jgi:hypothetical protein
MLYFIAVRGGLRFARACIIKIFLLATLKMYLASLCNVMPKAGRRVEFLKKLLHWLL